MEENFIVVAVVLSKSWKSRSKVYYTENSGRLRKCDTTWMKTKTESDVNTDLCQLVKKATLKSYFLSKKLDHIYLQVMSAG